MNRDTCARLFQEATRYIPGGVNSPVRAFRAVGGSPVFVAQGEGPYVYDEDGNRYVDLVMSWGPLIFGHAPKPVVEAITQAARKGTSFGMPTAAEVELARLIVELVPSAEVVRLVNSGTEATMSAIRVARAYTHRDYLVKFAGCYHGHADHLLVKAGSGATTLGAPDSAGVPAQVAARTIIVPYNCPTALEVAFDEHGEEIAAVIVEPIAGNMGVVQPTKDFLQALQEIAKAHGSLLIFDEVITGFRVGLGGAQEMFGIKPDLTCLGKIIGGGLPVGAYAGRRDIMEQVAPMGPVYQAGTLSGNPLAVAAGLAVLKALKADPPYERLDEAGQRLCEGLVEVARRRGVRVQLNRVGSMFTLFFASGPVHDYATALGCNKAMYARYFGAMLEKGVLLPPSQFEANFLSTAHGEREIDHVLNAAEYAFSVCTRKEV